MTSMLTLIALQAIAVPVDTAAVITAALERARTDYGVEFRGAGFEAQRRTPALPNKVEPIATSVASVLATRYDLTLLTFAEGVHCGPLDPDRSFPFRTCRLLHTHALVSVVVNEVGRDVAVVSVAITTPSHDSIFSRSVTYELACTDERWAVTRIISRGAS